METRTAPFYLLASTSKLPAGSFYQGGLAQLTPKTLSVSWIEQKPKRNYVMQWNLNVQRELTKDLTATIGYVGSHGVHQPMRVDDANIVMPTLTEAGYVWPSPVGSGTLVNPNFGEIRSMQWIGTSVYHALQLNLTQRMAHGVLLRGSYTWGKSFDTGSSTIVGDEFLTSMSSLSQFDLRLNRGVSDFDVAQTLVIAFYAHLRYGRRPARPQQQRSLGLPQPARRSRLWFAGEPGKSQPLYKDGMFRGSHGPVAGVLLAVLRSELPLSNLYQPARQCRTQYPDWTWPH
jgi:hypothetical protein